MAATISGLHECTLTRTNSGGAVAVCTCSWIGSVHPAPRHERPDGRRGPKDHDAADRAARAEWDRHYKVTHAALVPPNLENARRTLTVLGRFGHP